MCQLRDSWEATQRGGSWLQWFSEPIPILTRWETMERLRLRREKAEQHAMDKAAIICGDYPPAQRADKLLLLLEDV